MDIALRFTDVGIDFAIEDGDLAVDRGFRTPVLVSLFSDARIEDPADLVYPETDPRGWWADEFQDSRMGSTLWLYDRAKITKGTVADVRDAGEVGLEWFLREGFAGDISVEVQRLNRESLLMRVELDRGESSRGADLWEAMAAEILTFETPLLQVQLLTR